MQGDDRLNAVFVQLVKNVVVELQAGFIGLRVVPIGKDARPGDGHPVAFKAHFGKKLDILFVVMIKVDRFMAGIIAVGMDMVMDNALLSLTAAHLYVCDA